MSLNRLVNRTHRPMPKSDPGVAVSLGSAFLGYYAHAGFLNGLNEAGIFPGKICGASAGALAASLYAAGVQGDELRDFVMDRNLKKAFIDPGFLYRWFPMLVFGQPVGLLSGKSAIKYFEGKLPVSRIENCPSAELAIAVSNLRKKKCPILKEGPLAQSIVASCSVPILFGEQEIEGERYFDGGILHESPLEHYFEDDGIHTIIVHRVDYPNPKKRYFFIHDIFTASHAMFSAEITDYRKREAELRGKRLIFVDTHHAHPGLLQSQEKKLAFYLKGKETGESTLKALR